MVGISGTVGVKEEIFGSGAEGFVPFSLTQTGNEWLAWPQADSEHGPRPFSRVTIQKRCSGLF